METYIPPKTAEKLATPYSPGTRHNAAVEIAIPMIGNGASREAVFHTLRGKFSDLPEKELQDIVNWAANKNPTPSTPTQPFQYNRVRFNPPPPPKPKSPLDHASWWLRGVSMTLERFKEFSQLAIPIDRKQALCLALEMLWLGEENLNIVAKYIMGEDGKAKPSGGGRTLTRDKWLEYVRSNGIPESRAGCWLRPNPCKAVGSGAGGAIMDSDIVEHRFLLLESDVLPLEIQLALFSKLKLPIAYCVLSGGHSVHAFVKVGAKDAKVFDELVRRILTPLSAFGIDQANKNASRLSRLPCAKREIGAENGGEQTLLWLNPGVSAVTAKDLDLFESSLEIPALEEKPFKKIVQDALVRYDYLLANKGKLGVPTGLATLDRIMGGWKPSMTIIAAKTGAGKTTLALNFINRALESGNGVVLFSMEMTSEDVCDMLVSLNGRVDRNVFNTGEFTEGHMRSITVATAKMQDWPFWIEDASTITLEQIRKQVLQLKSEGRIGLVVVDYAQLVSPSNAMDSREQQVATIGRSLRVLSKDAEIPILVLSQLNDEGRLRESRVLGHEAANVFQLNDEDGKYILLTQKGRKIPSKPISLYFDAVHCRFEEMAPTADVPTPAPRSYDHENS